MKIWSLYYGTQTGDAGDCSIFYTPQELFLSEEDLKAREAEVQADQKKIGDKDAYTEVKTFEVKAEIEAKFGSVLRFSLPNGKKIGINNDDDPGEAAIKVLKGLGFIIKDVEGED